MATLIFNIISVTLTTLNLGIAINLSFTPKLKKWVSVLLFMLPGILLNYIFSYSALVYEQLSQFALFSAIKALLLTVSFLLYFLLGFKEKTSHKVIGFLVFQVMVAVSEFAYAFVISLFYDVSAVEHRLIQFPEVIYLVIVQVVMYFLLAVLFYFLMKKMVFRLPVKILALFFVIVILNCMIILGINIATTETKDTLTRVVLFCAPVLLTVMCVALYKMMVKFSETEVMKEKLYWVENVKGMELDYYNKLQEKTNEVRKIRHDFKDNLETAKLLIKENSEESIEKASEIISAMEKSINATKLPVYTENIVVNAIVGAKAEEASKKGITLETQIDVPKELTIESIDLNCVFLNLLNNAIEASEKLEKAEKTISLRSGIKAGFLFVKVENEFKTLETNQGGKLVTTKEDKENHGIGTSLINEIAKKYDGEFETSIENSQFIAVVSLKV